MPYLHHAPQQEKQVRFEIPDMNPVTLKQSDSNLAGRQTTDNLRFTSTSQDSSPHSGYNFS